MLRDKFAMAAMQGMQRDATKYGWTAENVANLAYRQAEAMMKERANWDFSGDPDSVTIKSSGSQRPVPPDIPTPPIKYE